MRFVVAMMAGAVVLTVSSTGATAKLGYRWEQWKPLSRVYDVDGPRMDGALVAATRDGLFTIATNGNISPFARGQGGFALGDDSESYLAVSPGLRGSAAAGCEFSADSVYVLALGKPLGLTFIDPSGTAHRFATIDGPDSLNGIAFDKTGRFDRRLLVTGPKSGKTEVFAVDCKGTVSTVTTSAPAMEGGIAVAPGGFGAYGGDLIAPDENSDQIWAVAPDGSSHLVTTTGLAKGADIGVESVGFVPPGFMEQGGFAYVADRGTPGNSHPGTDTIVRYPSSEMQQVGSNGSGKPVHTVNDGDLIVVTEGAGSTVVVHCLSSCTADIIGKAADAAHIEGHVAFTLSPKSSSSPSQEAPIGLPAESSSSNRLQATAAVVAALAVLIGIALVLRRRRS